MAWKPTPGEVVPYTYLWWREHEAGEESGRKVRPCVVVVSIRRLEGDSMRVAVAAITHAQPSDRPAVEMPRAVKQRLDLDEHRSWVICDELNLFEWPGFDLDRTPTGAPSFGRIPDALLGQIKQKLRKGAVRMVNRDE